MTNIIHRVIVKINLKNVQVTLCSGNFNKTFINSLIEKQNSTHSFEKHLEVLLSRLTVILDPTKHRVVNLRFTIDVNLVGGDDLRQAARGQCFKFFALRNLKHRRMTSVE